MSAIPHPELRLPAPPVSVAARRHPVVDDVRRFLRGAELLGTEFPLVVGVSGGTDSCALLLALAAIAASGRCRPVVVHVHHHLRGADADADAGFTEELAQRLRLPFERCDVHPGPMGSGPAAAARKARYDALAAAAARRGARAVAVAHHADDQLETILLALVRGTGIRGLAGMPERRVLDGDVDLIRPLLRARRADLADLCETAGVTPREDPTNDDVRGPRARLRHDVIPMLDAMRPDVARRVTNTARCVTELIEAEAVLVEDAFGPASRRRWARSDLAALPASIVSAGLRRAAIAMVPGLAPRLAAVDLDHAARLIRDGMTGPRRLDLPEATRLLVDRNEVRLEWRSGS